MSKYIADFKNGRSVAWASDSFRVFMPSKSGGYSVSIADFEMSENGLSIALCYAARGELTAQASVDMAREIFPLGRIRAHKRWLDL